MLDQHLIRNKLDEVQNALDKRGVQLDIEQLSGLEQERKEIQVETQDLQAERNRRSKEIGKLKAAGENIQPLLDEVADLGERLKADEEKPGINYSSI